MRPREGKKNVNFLDIVENGWDRSYDMACAMKIRRYYCRMKAPFLGLTLEILQNLK